MNIDAISRSRTQRVLRTAISIWKGNSLADIKKRLIEIWQDEFTPLCDFWDEPLTCAVLGSGTFSTGRHEIYIAKEIEKELGWAPVKYKLILTNNKNSRASDVADEFGLPLLEIDFSSWYEENYNTISKFPIKDTSLFVQGIDKNSLIRRFKIRAEFDSALRDGIEKFGGLPDLVSLRGYNFPLIYTFTKGKKVLIDDTHPADMSLVDTNGIPLCPGWQTGAVKKMLNCGCKKLRSSLIEVKPFSSVSDVLSLDTGALYALSPGISPPEHWGLKKIQENMKRTEDFFLCALKGSGIFPYLFGVSTLPKEVEYITDRGEVVLKKEPAIIVGERIKSGRNAFGRTLEELRCLFPK